LCLLSFSIHAQQCSVEGGHVNEMIQAPVNKFQTLNNQAIQNIVTPCKMFNFWIQRIFLEHYNFSWVVQESPPYSLFLAQTQLAKSCYEKDIEALP
jgi:hypothetical protein